MIDSAKLAEWEGLAEKATPGPWVGCGGRHRRISVIDSRELKRRIATMHVGRMSEEEIAANGDFIAASREALPALIAEVRRLQNEAAKEAYIADVYRRKAEGLEAENAELRRET